MKTMKDYLDLYLSCDVLSLADGLKKLRNKIRNSTLENYRYANARVII